MPQTSHRGWRPLRGHLRLLVSGGLVLVIGALGLVAGQDAGDRARDVHRADRVDLQRTLAGLVGQYTQVSAAEVSDMLASQQPWSAAVGDPATTGRLKDLVDQTRALDAGAVLISPLGVPLASYSVAGDLPATNDPGWSPLRRTALAGDGTLPLSGVLTSSREPQLAMGLPIRLSDGTRGLLIGLSTARGGALQQYVSTLSYGDTGHGYVVDGAGVVVAGPYPADVGRPLGRERLRSALLAGSRGLLETDDGEPLLTSAEPAGQTGWLSLTAQDQEEFEGALDRASRLVQVAVVALLLIAGTGLVVVHRKRESALEDVALQDELTGVLNRRGWSALAEHELQRARRQATTRALLFVDVDGLKQVNDQLGHREGDRALVGAAQVLTSCSRSTDLVGRFGGDEFVLLLSEDAEADQVRARILATLDAHNARSDSRFELRLSLGAQVWFPDHATTLAELVRRADEQMYADKQSRPRRAEGVVRVPAALDVVTS